MTFHLVKQYMIISGNEKGFDGGKKVKGRKRHILVDTLGLIIAIVIHEANIHDSVGAKLVLFKAFKKLSTLKIIWADQGYQGLLV